MNYLMAPLEQHADDGFGAMALAFREAALFLATQDKNVALLQHLPRNFLLRHAIELFLKSGIVILHRELDIPFGTEPSTSEPMVPDGNKWKPLYKVHSVATLFAHLATLIASNNITLRERSKFKPDWSIPPEFPTWIETIENIDRSSTYYRYPMTTEKDDTEKSAFKESPIQKILDLAPGAGKQVTAAIVENKDGRVVRAFVFDHSTDAAASEALEKAADMLNNFHAMMRMELTGGW